MNKGGGEGGEAAHSGTGWSRDRGEGERERASMEMGR